MSPRCPRLDDSLSSAIEYGSGTGHHGGERWRNGPGIAAGKIEREVTAAAPEFAAVARGQTSAAERSAKSPAEAGLEGPDEGNERELAMARCYSPTKAIST